MIPSTLLGLLLFLGAVGPGYVYLRVSERRRPHVGRTGVAEAAEFLVTGALASAFAAVLWICLLDATGQLNTEKLAAKPRSYLLEHLTQVSLIFMGVLITAYLAAWGAARLIHWGEPVSIHHGFNSWYAMISKGRPTASVPYVTVDLHDGTTVSGWPRVFTVEEVPLEQRELVLAEPLLRRSGESDFRRTTDHCVAIHGAEVRTVSVRYQAVTRQLNVSAPPARPPHEPRP